MRPDRRSAPAGARSPRTLLAYAALCLCLAACLSCGGKAVSPVCSISPDTLNFGNVSLGTSEDRAFTVTNLGADTLSGHLVLPCSGYSTPGGAFFSLGPGQAATLTVRFAPTIPGRQDCQISTGLKTCPLITAFASADTGYVCSESATSLEFGPVTVGGYEDRILNVTNSGTEPFTARLLSVCGDYRLAGGANGGTLEPGDSMQFTIRFQPQGAGIQECTLSTGLPCRPVHLHGVGVSAPACPIGLNSSALIDFREVGIGQIAEQDIVIYNRSISAITGHVQSSCSDLSVLTQEGTPGNTYSLRPGQYGVFLLRWQPMVAGPLSCTVGLGDSACTGVTVVGYAPAAATCLVTPESLDFGTVPVGESARRDFTITNTSAPGSGLLLSGYLEANCGNYSVVGGNPFSLGPGQSTVFTIQFTPSAPGRSDCTITTNLASCGSLTVTGIGL